MSNASNHITTAQHSNVRHEAWCSVEAHEVDLAEFAREGCCGTPIGDPVKMGGWLEQAAPGEEPRIVLDTRELGFRHNPLTLADAADLISFLARALAEAGGR